MTTWTAEELRRIDASDELEIAARRRDGTLRRHLPVWVVRHGDGLYVRAVNGRDSAWFRGAQARHEGHVRAGGVEKNVSFVDPDPDLRRHRRGLPRQVRQVPRHRAAHRRRAGAGRRDRARACGLTARKEPLACVSAGQGLCHVG